MLWLLLYHHNKSAQVNPLVHTFMQCTTSQGLKLSKVVHQVAVLVLGLRGHVVKLPDVTLPDPQGEDLNTAFPQGCRHRPRVPAVRVAIGDQENDLGGVGARVTEDLLLEKYILIYIFQKHVNFAFSKNQKRSGDKASPC